MELRDTEKAEPQHALSKEVRGQDDEQAIAL